VSRSERVRKMRAQPGMRQANKLKKRRRKDERPYGPYSAAAMMQHGTGNIQRRRKKQRRNFGQKLEGTDRHEYSCAAAIR